MLFARENMASPHFFQPALSAVSLFTKPEVQGGKKVEKNRLTRTYYDLPLHSCNSFLGKIKT